MRCLHFISNGWPGFERRRRAPPGPSGPAGETPPRGGFGCGGGVTAGVLQSVVVDGQTAGVLQCEGVNGFISTLGCSFRIHLMETYPSGLFQNRMIPN